MVPEKIFFYFGEIIMADNINADIERAKKQAKNLLKTIRQEPDFKIESLTDAQQIIARINGFQHWHHLIKSLSTKENPEKSEKEISQNNHALWSDKSNLCYLTSDNKPFYYQPYSANQERWISAITGPDRVGFASELIRKTIAITLPWTKDTPVTHQSYYFEAGGSEVKKHLEEIREHLSPDQHDYLNYQKVTSQSSFNFFETPIGFDFPLNEQYQFLQDWLYEDVFRFNEENQSETEIKDIISNLIVKLYHENNRVDFKYQLGVNQNIDNIFDSDKLEFPKTWKELTLYLFQNAQVDLAKVAHAQSVPCLNDMVGVLDTQLEVSDFFKDIYFLASIRLKEYIAKYPSLCQRQKTLFDISKGRYYFFEIALENQNDAEKYRKYLYAQMGIQFNLCLLVQSASPRDKAFLHYYTSLGHKQKISIKTVYLHEMNMDKSSSSYKMLTATMKEGKRMAHNIVFTTENRLDNVKDKNILEWTSTHIETGITSYRYMKEEKVVIEELSPQENEIAFLFSAKTRMRGRHTFLLKTMRDK
jgi:hypothetical protein